MVTIVTAASPALALEQARLRYPLASIYDYDSALHGLNSRARTKEKRKLAAAIKREFVVGSHDIVLVLRSDIKADDIFGEPVDANIVHIRKGRSDKGIKKVHIIENDDNGPRDQQDPGRIDGQ